MKKNAIKKIRPFRDINIGLVVFLFIAIYILINIYIYFTKNEISIYEVPGGTLYSIQTYRGLIMRTEETVYTDMTGYLNYYHSEGDRIRKNEPVYSIDSDRSIYSRLNDSSAEIKLSDEDTEYLKKNIMRKYLEAERFSDYAGLKDTLLTTYRKKLDERVINDLNKIVAETGISSNFSVVNSPKAGILSYYYDDLSDINADSLTPELFEGTNNETTLYTPGLLKAGSPVYKIITNEDWQIAVKIDENLFKKVHSLSKVSFTINGSLSVTADFTPIVKNNDYYIIIYLSKYITNYSGMRYVDIAFDTKDTEGLKIPLTSVVYKDYYRIPAEYFTVTENDEYALKEEFYDSDKGERAYKDREVEVFYSDGTYYYIDTNLIPSDTYIMTDEENGRTMLYVFTTKVEGAYNVNNGYAEFRRIERISSDGDYLLIEKNSKSGLKEFDHIVLESSKAKEGEVIY